MRSHFLVVPYFTCDIPGCSGKAKYTETRTVKALPQPNTFTETFDGMQFDGICATEYITLGDPDNQQLLITDAVFHAATAISGRFGDIQADGVFGLGLNYPGDKYKTVFQTGLDQNIFVGPYITFAMFKNKKPDQVSMYTILNNMLIQMYTLSFRNKSTALLRMVITIKLIVKERPFSSKLVLQLIIYGL